MMIVVSLVAGGGLALSRMRVDIFTPINQPQIVTEVVRKVAYPTNGPAGTWQDFDGSEKVIIGDLSEISDGEKVAMEDTQVQQPKLTSFQAGPDIAPSTR
jgi:hypothetical protein